jgi:hypothetical protein
VPKKKPKMKSKRAALEEPTKVDKTLTERSDTVRRARLAYLEALEKYVDASELSASEALKQLQAATLLTGPILDYYVKNLDTPGTRLHNFVLQKLGLL